MYTDSTAAYYAQLYTEGELRQLRATACAELATLSTAPGPAASHDDDAELTNLLDRIRLYTAALLVQARMAQLVA